MDFHHLRATDIGVHRNLRAFSLLHSRIWFRRDDALHISQNAELSCEIRMMRRSAILITGNAMDAHYCRLLLESPTQLEGALLKRQIFRRLFFD